MISLRWSPVAPFCCVLLSCLLIPFLPFGVIILDGTFQRRYSRLFPHSPCLSGSLIISTVTRHCYVTKYVRQPLEWTLNTKSHRNIFRSLRSETSGRTYKQELYVKFTSFVRQIFHKALNTSPVFKTINRLIIQLFHGIYSIQSVF